MFQYKFTSKRCRTGLLPVGGATRKRARSELGTAASNEATSEININNNNYYYYYCCYLIIKEFVPFLLYWLAAATESIEVYLPNLARHRDS